MNKVKQQNSLRVPENRRRHLHSWQATVIFPPLRLHFTSLFVTKKPSPYFENERETFEELKPDTFRNSSWFRIMECTLPIQISYSSLISATIRWRSPSMRSRAGLMYCDVMLERKRLAWLKFLIFSRPLTPSLVINLITMRCVTEGRTFFSLIMERSAWLRIPFRTPHYRAYCSLPPHNPFFALSCQRLVFIWTPLVHYLMWDSGNFIVSPRIQNSNKKVSDRFRCYCLPMENVPVSANRSFFMGLTVELDTLLSVLFSVRMNISKYWLNWIPFN